MARILDDGSYDLTNKAHKDLDNQAARPPEGHAGNVRHTSRSRGEDTDQAGINDAPQRPGLGLGEQHRTMPNVAAQEPHLTPGNMAEPMHVAGEGIRHFSMAPMAWHWFARSLEEQAEKLRPSGLDLENKDDERNRAR